MAGNHEVAGMQARLDATFQRVDYLGAADLELRSDFARYLCILVSGFVENAVTALTMRYCDARSHLTVASYAGVQLSKIQNLNSERLVQVVGAFERRWREELIVFLEGPRKDALDSVVSLRNQIAHGESVGVTFARIKEYYNRVKEIVAFLGE